MLLILSLHDGDFLFCLATLIFSVIAYLMSFCVKVVVTCVLLGGGGGILLFPFLLYLCFDVKLFLTKFVLISLFKGNHLLSFSTLLLLSSILFIFPCSNILADVAI
ncbi:hypothetical protein HN51_070695 [Arachis hypogaea]